ADNADRQRKMIQDREKRILDSISDAFGSIDEHSRLIHANKQLAALTLQPLPQIVGKEIWEILPELAAPTARAELERSLRDETHVRLEIYFSRSGCWYEVRLYPQERGLSIFCHNITEQKRGEERLRESEERLRLASEAARIGTWT